LFCFFFSNTDSNCIKYICVIYFHFFVFLDVLFVPLTSFFNGVKICVTSYFMYGVSHVGKYCTFNKILVRKAQISVEIYLIYQSVSQKSILCDVYFITLNFMILIWCFMPISYCSTDQWRRSLGVRDSESCWFTEERGTYMRCWESPGDLTLLIEFFVSFRSFRYAPLAKRHNISIPRGRSPGISR
jgi:hypothetical protein